MLCCARLENVLRKIRWLWASAYLFCTCWFLYQLVQILPNYFHPTLTRTDANEVPLNSTDFPLDVKICFQPAKFNETVLKSFGYNDSLAYWDGMINYNGSYGAGYALVGWGGKQSARVGNASEVLHAAKYDWTKSQLFDYFTIWPEPGDGNPNVTLQRVNWVDSCYVVNMDMVDKKYLSSMKTLFMAFNESTLSKHNVTVELKLQGKNLVAHRNIQAHLFYHDGDAIKLDKTSQFAVKIKRRVFIEGEPGTTCRNYPNSDFKSYRDCDDRYMKARVDVLAPGMNLTPVWMTEDLSKVTTRPVVVSLNALSKCNFAISYTNTKCIFLR